MVYPVLALRNFADVCLLSQQRRQHTAETVQLNAAQHVSEVSVASKDAPELLRSVVSTVQ